MVSALKLLNFLIDQNQNEQKEQESYREMVGVVVRQIKQKISQLRSGKELQLEEFRKSDDDNQVNNDEVVVFLICNDIIGQSVDD